MKIERFVCWALAFSFIISWWVQGHPAVDAQHSYQLGILLCWMATLKG